MELWSSHTWLRLFRRVKILNRFDCKYQIKINLISPYAVSTNTIYFVLNQSQFIEIYLLLLHLLTMCIYFRIFEKQFISCKPENYCIYVLLIFLIKDHLVKCYLWIFHLNFLEEILVIFIYMIRWFFCQYCLLICCIQLKAYSL